MRAYFKRLRCVGSLSPRRSPVEALDKPLMAIAFPQSSSGSSTIQQWEAAGTSLVAALANYANSCLSLGLNFAGNNAQIRNLAFQIDSALETHSAINMQLRRSGASLSRMRNQVITPLHRIPGEILSHIFMDVIYDSRIQDLDGRADGNYTESRILRIDRRRHNLLSVCSIWRNVISTRTPFWSTILITNSGIRHQMLKTYLQRARGSMLRLVVTADKTISDHVIDTLSSHVPQIRSLIIQSYNYLEFRRVVNMFLKKDTPHSLSVLSLRWTGISLSKFEEPGNIFPLRARTGCLPASALIESLPTLRFSHTYPHWDPTRATKLLKLQIDSFHFREEAGIIACLHFISLAPQLRNLELFSINCSSYPDPPDLQENLRRPRTISFPNLQSLTIGEFVLDDLRIILGSIHPGSHRLVLCLSDGSFLNDCDLGVDRLSPPHAEGLISALGLAPVDSLLLDDQCQYCLEDEAKLFELLSSVPELKSLKMAGWRIDGHLWDALMRPSSRNMLEDTNAPEFPRLQNLHLNNDIIRDEERLKAVVKSHGIQRLELGVRKSTRPLSEPDELEPPSVETIDWLRSTVPELSLVNLEYYSPDFDTSGWDSPISD